MTAVGGTALGVTQANARQFETGWGTTRYTTNGSSWSGATWLYGAGGGFSEIFSRPSYQQGVVTSGSGRAVPDIAMDADPTTGMRVGETQDFEQASVWGPAGVHYGEYRIGGTSLASPLMAGAQAIAQQGSRGRIGFANPLIYRLASKAGVFYDPTAASPDAGNVRSDYINGYNAADGLRATVRTFDEDSSLTTTRGWDDVTGVGTVTGGYLKEVGRR